MKLSFSPDGQYFVIFWKKMNVMHIYDIPEYNLEKLLDNIENEEISPIKEFKTFTGSVAF